jgi:hypothetical protein
MYYFLVPRTHAEAVHGEAYLLLYNTKYCISARSPVFADTQIADPSINDYELKKNEQKNRQHLGAIHVRAT